MRPFPFAFAAVVLLAAPLAAQTASRPGGSASPTPTKVVARSGRLVTARTSAGGTQSFNCEKPENKRRKVCKH